MKIIKSRYFILITLNILIFLTLLAILFSNQSDLSEEMETLNNLNLENDGLAEAIFKSKSIERDLIISQNEKNKAVKLVRDTKNYIDNLLNIQENLNSKYQNNSISVINGEINRLLPSLRQRCEQAGISFNLTTNENSFGNEGNGLKNKDFGFSFASYDGFWPNFNKNEANRLGLQAAIVKQIVDFLVTSALDEPLSIESIKRESVGEIDQKFIGDSKIDLTDVILLGHNENISTLAFSIVLRGNTNHARNFVNQLRPPYCLRKFTAFRNISKQKSDSLDSFVLSTEKSTEKDILPIINDIESKFSLIIEYVYDVDYDIDTIISVSTKHSNDSSLENILINEIKSTFNF